MAARGAGIVPTEQQRVIRDCPDGSILVEANAGAAKTTTLALRIAAALQAGVEPGRILALTYTRPAVQALAGALRKVGVPDAVVRRLPIRTFDTCAAGILEGIERGRVPFRATPEELAPTVWQAVQRLDLPADDGMVERFLRAAARLKGTLARDRLRWDDIRLTPDSAEDLGIEYPMLRLFDAYEVLRDPRTDGVDRPRFRGPYDATYDLARLLAEPESSTPLAEIAGWPRQLEHLLVDEMHDLNLAMFTILQALLTNKATRFCGVGDADQVVHAAAGAESRFMAPGVDLGSRRRVRALPLTATRRFAQGLARAAGRLAGKPYASDCAHATAIDCRSYADDQGAGCAHAVVEVARQWKAQDRRAADMAVLLRHAHQSVAIENALIRAEIPYATLGFESYLLQPEVLLVRALLAVATEDFGALSSEITRRRLVRAVVFFCGVRLTHGEDESESADDRLNQAIEHVAAEAASLEPFFRFQVLRHGDPLIVRHVQAAIDVARGTTGPDLFPRLLQALHMDRLVHQVFVERQRREDALAYMRGLAQAARSCHTAAEFFASLNRAETRAFDTRSALKDARRAATLRKDTLTLATVAEVKGLEFEHVVMPLLAQGVFPAALAPLAEERNLFYVGITRARQALTLLVDAQRPSELVEAAGFRPSTPSRTTGTP